MKQTKEADTRSPQRNNNKQYLRKTTTRRNWSLPGGVQFGVDWNLYSPDLTFLLFRIKNHLIGRILLCVFGFELSSKGSGKINTRHVIFFVFGRELKD
jgi:hypothetical protein